MNISEKLMEAMKIETVFSIRLGGFEIPVTETVILSWIVMAVLIIAALLVTRSLKMVPTGAQHIVEGMVEFLNKTAKEHLGKYGPVFSPYLGTLALFLLAANIIPAITPLGAFSYEPLFEIKPPARDINLPAALAFISILLVLFSGIIVRGPLGWFKSLFSPMPAMLPFNLLEYIIKPMTLCLRLFGNMFGSFILMTLLNIALTNAIGASSGISALASLYFDFLDGFLQALIFTFLTLIYVSEAIKVHGD